MTGGVLPVCVNRFGIELRLPSPLISAVPEMGFLSGTSGTPGFPWEEGCQ